MLISQLPFQFYSKRDTLYEYFSFIQQGCNKLMTSDSKDIYNITQDFYFK